MRVLLLGEYSSLHKFLKEGLSELGIDVTLAANGDGWKKIDGADTCLFQDAGDSIPSKLAHRIAEPIIKADKFRDYDVVQVINTKIYSHLINERLLKSIKKHNRLFSLLSVGGTYRLYEAYRSKAFDYWMYDGGIEKEYTGDTRYSKRWIKNDLEIEKIADIIIPMAYEYHKAYENNPKCHDAIPLPINVRDIQYTENIVKDKVVFFHGISRPNLKGTEFIVEALNRLRDKYPNDVEIILPERVPYNEYIKMMARTNVLLDQCRCYSYGINACLAMASGKVVCAGNREESRSALGVEAMPIVEIRPNADFIFDQMCNILGRRNEILKIGIESRKYVEEMHDHVKVAKRYVDAWKTVMENM